MKELAIVVSNKNRGVNPVQTMDAIKKAGFKNVFLQWYDENWEMSQEAQLEYARTLGLNVIFVHLGYQSINDLWKDDEELGKKLVERYKNDIISCSKHGINMVIMHLTSKTKADPFSQIGLNRINEIVECAKENGVHIAFENTKIEGYLEYVLENITDENVGLCYDAGHCHAHFKDRFDYDLVKNRIKAVHLHDNFGENDDHLMPYDGTIDWNDVTRKLKNCNYEGPITLELIYRHEYVEKMSIEEFFKEAFERGKKLQEMF